MLAGITLKEDRTTLDNIRILKRIPLISTRAAEVSRLATLVTIQHLSIVTWYVSETMFRLEANFTVRFDFYIMLNFV